MQEVFVYKEDGEAISQDVEMVRIDPTVKVIEKYAFEDCQKLKHVFFSKQLTEIGSSAFANCKSLLSIRLPLSVKVIGKGAFFQCESLRHVILKEGLEVLEKDAFSGCGMELLYLPSTVKCIKTGCFDDCQSLKRVALMSQELKVENYAFNQCDILETIEVPASNSSSCTFEPFAFPEKAVIVAFKDVEFWKDVQERFEQEDIVRMQKYGVVLNNEMSIDTTSKPSPPEESTKRKRPRASLQVTRKQETRQEISKRLAEKQQHIEWLQKLLASAQRERDELQAKLSECDMLPPE